MADITTFRQAIDLTYRLNEQSLATVQRELGRTREERLQLFKNAYGSLSDMSQQYQRDRVQTLERYMGEFAEFLRTKTTLTSDQAKVLEDAERERVTNLLDQVRDHNGRLLSATEAAYKSEEQDQGRTIDAILDSEGKIREIRREGLGESGRESDGVLSTLWDGINKLVSIAHSMGAPIAGLSIEEGLRFGIATYEHRLRERKAEFRIAAAGGQLTPSGSTFDMDAYTAGIRDLRVKFPSLRERFDDIGLSLKQQMPDLDAKSLVALVDDTRRLSFFTGESMETLAAEMGTMSRHLGVPSGEIAGKMLWMTELGRFYAKSHDVNIDLGKFRSNIANLADQNRLYGMSLEEAGALTFRFAKELDRGILSLDDITAATLGYSKADPTKLAYFGQEALRWMEGKSGYEEILGVLKRFSYSGVVLQRAFTILSSKSEAGYRELGIHDRHWKDRERFQQQAGVAVNYALKNFADMIGRNQSERNYIWREAREKMGTLSPNVPIGPAQKLGESGLVGVTGEEQTAEGAAAGIVGHMDGWRKWVDKNQDQTESALERLWEYFRMGATALLDFTTGASKMLDVASDAVSKINEYQKNPSKIVEDVKEWVSPHSVGEQSFVGSALLRAADGSVGPSSGVGGMNAMIEATADRWLGQGAGDVDLGMGRPDPGHGMPSWMQGADTPMRRPAVEAGKRVMGMGKLPDAVRFATPAALNIYLKVEKFFSEADDRAMRNLGLLQTGSGGIQTPVPPPPSANEVP